MIVIPAKAGTHLRSSGLPQWQEMGPRLWGGDNGSVLDLGLTRPLRVLGTQF